MSVETTQLGNYLESFTEFAKNTARETPPWLRELREFAFARFCSAGFPTTRDEDWRFTNVAALARTPFHLARENAVQLTVTDLEALANAGRGCADGVRGWTFRAGACRRGMRFPIASR